MTPTDALATLAEVSVALAASTGIILALTRDPGAWQPFDALRVYLLLGASLGATVLALVPIGLMLVGLQGTAVWRISSAGLLAFMIGFLAVAAARLVALAPEARADFRPALGIAFNATNVVVLIVQALNAAAIGLAGTVAPFYFGLLWLVAWSAILFALLIFLRPGARERSADRSANRS